MLKLVFCLCAGVALAHESASAQEAPRVVICDFEDPASLKKLDWSKETTELTIGPRTPADLNKVLRYAVLGGQYPSFTFYPPHIPKDWSPYEALSFVVWTPSDCAVSVRIDDEKSFNFASRYNGGCNLQKGRTLVQIPVKNIAKNLDVSKIKQLVLFTCEPPKGLTLWFDDLMLGPLQTQKVDFIPYAERYDLIPSLEVVSPHLPLARPLAGGPVPVFMLTGARFGREVVEMMQRMDLKVSQLTWDREWGANTWGFGDFYGRRGHSTDYVLMQRYLDSSMQGPEHFGALVMYTPLGWNRFTASAREYILKRVKDQGEGLVLVMPFPGDQNQPWPNDLKEACALINSKTDWIRDGCDMRYPNEGRVQGKKWVKTKDHPITAGVPIEALPFQNMETQKYEAAPGADVLIRLESGEPVLAVKQLGKGRVVTFATRAASLTPQMDTPQDYPRRVPYRFWEVWYSLADRAVLWAAGREFKRDGAPVALKAEGEHADPALTARQWKDAEGRVTDWELVFAPPTDEGERLALSVPDAVKPGEEIKASFTPPEAAANARWTARLGEIVGGQWRTMEQRTFDPAGSRQADGTVSLALPTARIRQYVAYIRVEAERDGKRVATGKAEVVVTPEPKWDDYEVHTWLEYGLPFLRDFEMGRMREFGLTANTVGPSDHVTCRCLLRGGMRLHACGLTNGLHAKDIDAQEKKYKETKNKEFLIRHPSYADAAFVEKERKSVASAARNIAKFAPIAMIMSDETALTSYTRDFDFDFHPDNIAAFREKLKARFGEIAALNAAVGSAFKSFDEVQAPTTDEARQAGNFGLWNAWRAHNDDMWTGAFRMYGDAMKEQYAGSRLSVSGSQEQAVFNGIDWAKLTPTFEAISGYGGRFQELQRLSFHPGSLRVTPWGAYGRSGRAVDHQLWSSLTTGGCGMGLFWWYSLRNADLTWCQSGKDYKRVIAEMQSGVGKQYMLAQRHFSPLAVLWSANSQRAAWAAGKFEEFKKVEADVMQALTDAGFDPFFVSETAAADGELAKRGVRVVVLPMSLSVGQGAKKGGLAVLPALNKLTEGGGLCVVTHPPTCDEFLQPAPAANGKFTMFADVKGDLVAAFAKAGVKPWVRAARPDGSRVPNVSATVHKVPGRVEGWLVTVLRPPVGTKEVVGADGVIHTEPDASGGKEVETLTVDLAALGALNVYDLRKGTLLKPAEGKVTLEMTAGDGYPLALLPYTVGELKVSKEVKDRALSVRWELAASSAERATHVTRLEVLDAASGKAIPYLRANAVADPDGKGAFTFPLAEEDQGREFQVQARDVLTGRSGSAK